MKKIIMNLAIAPMLIVGTLCSFGCQTPEQKVNSAKENVKDAKDDLKEVQKDANAEARKTANAEEWRQFKSDSEAKIRSNEAVIDELNTKMHSSGKKVQAVFEEKIADLKQRNRDLTARINSYEKNQSNDWESFKREFNHDMDELGQGLKTFTVNNKN
jgi:chromosome segregation ATPase